MKRILLTTIAMALYLGLYAQQDTVVRWTFPGNDGFADGGLAINLLKEINTDGGTSAITFKNGATTKAAQTTGWDNGAGTKQWLVEFSAAGYQDLHVSSKLSSGGTNPGPRDYQLQYRIDCTGVWTSVPGGNITTANDWTTGVLTNIALPSGCNDAISLHLRWIMVSDTATDGSIVDSTGVCKIDDIIVTGAMITSIPEAPVAGQLTVFPNPASGYTRITGSSAGISCTFVSPEGRVVTVRQPGTDGILDLAGLNPGLYLLMTRNKEGILLETNRIIIEAH